MIGTGLSDEEDDLTFQIDIRIVKRSARKSMTFIENLLENVDPSDHKKLLHSLRKTLNCSVSIATTKDDRTLIKLSGDQRQSVANYLFQANICQMDHIIVHGF